MRAGGFYPSRPLVDAARRFGLVGDGAKDNTAGFADLCATAGQSLHLKAGTYRTGKMALAANTYLLLAPGCTLIDTGVLGAAERFINILSDGVRIVAHGARVVMTRADYTSGEQRHGVYIFGGTDVAIDGLESSDCGGDGFYIGGSAGVESQRVRLVNVLANNNRRQGCSIVNARSVRIVDSAFTGTTGTAPCSGIDIEPNAVTDICEDIKIVRPRCTDNDGAGISVFLGPYQQASPLLYVDIDIVKPYTARNGGVSQSGSFRGAIDLRRVASTNPPKGRIRIMDWYSKDEKCSGLTLWDWDELGPRVEIIRPTVISPNSLAGTSSPVNGGLILYNSGSYTATAGNVLIDRPIVRDDSGALNTATLNPIRIGGKWNNVSILNPLITYAGANPFSIDALTARVTIASNPELEVATTVGITMTDGRYLGRTITNAGAVAGIAITLVQATAARIGWRFSFECRADQTMAIGPNAADRIVPLCAAAAAGTLIRGGLRGQRIVLECIEAGYWAVKEATGFWAIDPGTAVPRDYTITNLVASRTLDGTSGSSTDVLRAVATLVSDLTDRGLIQ